MTTLQSTNKIEVGGLGQKAPIQMAESNESSDYYDDLAEEWEGGNAYSGGGGGSSISKKKKAAPTTVGRKRVGGVQAWGSDASVCPKGCVKKCCKGPTKTPTM